MKGWRPVSNLVEYIKVRNKEAEFDITAVKGNRRIGHAYCRLTGRVWEVWTDGDKVWIKKIKEK